MITKESKDFMKRVFRNWGYYSREAHKEAEKIKRNLKGGLKQ